MGHDVVNLGENQVIEFSNVVTNVGNLYRKTTGEFYCDLPGTYVFHVHILANPHRNVYAVLTKNRAIVSYIYAASLDSSYSHGSNTAILQLNRDDFVEVRAHEHYTSSGQVINHNWSSFSGFLLYPDVNPVFVG